MVQMAKNILYNTLVVLHARLFKKKNVLYAHSKNNIFQNRLYFFKWCTSNIRDQIFYMIHDHIFSQFFCAMILLFFLLISVYLYDTHTQCTCFVIIFFLLNQNVFKKKNSSFLQKLIGYDHTLSKRISLNNTFLSEHHMHILYTYLQCVRYNFNIVVYVGRYITLLYKMHFGYFEFIQHSSYYISDFKEEQHFFVEHNSLIVY